MFPLLKRSLSIHSQDHLFRANIKPIIARLRFNNTHNIQIYKQRDLLLNFLKSVADKTPYYLQIVWSLVCIPYARVSVSICLHDALDKTLERQTLLQKIHSPIYICTGEAIQSDRDTLAGSTTLYLPFHSNLSEWKWVHL